MSREPKVLSFDVVGTLIDFEGGMLNYIRAECGPAGAAIDAEKFLEEYRITRADHKTFRYPDDLARGYHLIAKAMGLPDSQALADGFVQSVRNWPAFPDSVDALRRLAARYKLVAMTNAQRWALNWMEQTLGKPFYDTVTVDDALCEKPDPKFFAFTRGRLSRDGYLADDILHVAQSQYHDIGVARSLGYTVCWIERRKGQPGFGGTIAVETLTKPDYHFASLAELADLAESGGLKMLHSVS
jgi:putative hydrolase of the HAD superfamily